MKKLIFAAVIILTAATACKQEMPLQKNNEVMQVQVRLAGIDSTSAARTEDKVLFVNIK